MNTATSGVNHALKTFALNTKILSRMTTDPNQNGSGEHTEVCSPLLSYNFLADYCFTPVGSEPSINFLRVAETFFWTAAGTLFARSW